MTTGRIVLVHSVYTTDQARLKGACSALAWVRKVVQDLDTLGTTTEWNADRMQTRMAQLHDAQQLLDALVNACLLELESNG